MILSFILRLNSLIEPLKYSSEYEILLEIKLLLFLSLWERSSVYCSAQNHGLGEEVADKIMSIPLEGEGRRKVKSDMSLFKNTI